MMALNREPKYVWAVYDIRYGLDESSATSITESLRSSNTKMASDSYTVSSSGFTLTNSTSIKVPDLAGKYIVNISKGSSTSITGTYIYYVRSVSSSGFNRTVTTTRYSSALIKGDTELYRVESDTMDYPVNGEQDGYWYVMIKGEKPMYVWDVYNVTATYAYKESSKSATVNFVSGDSIYMASSYSFSTSRGTFTLNNPTSTKWTSSFGDILNASGGSYWMKNSESGSYVMTGMLTEGTLTPTLELGGTQKYAVIDESATSYIKGTSTGTTVESDNNSAYPQDGARGDYWYVYSHSYTYEFDIR